LADADGFTELSRVCQQCVVALVLAQKGQRLAERAMGGPDGGTAAVASLQHHFQPARLNVKLGHERFSVGCCLPVWVTASQRFGLVWSTWFLQFAISPCERFVCGDKIPSAFCSPIDHKVCLQCAFS